MSNAVPCSAVVASLRAVGEDFEFYPTTDEIIRALVADIEAFRERHWNQAERLRSVLDVGAGAGKVLDALREKGGFSSLYAIEKSPTLCGLLPPDVFIVGTDFAEQSLLTKLVGVVFSNPPYSVFSEWSSKIIREAASLVVYLVIPVRWQACPEIAAALAYRGAKTEIVGEFSFVDAEDRAARARVHLLRVELDGDRDDAFDRFFEEQFSSLREKFRASRDPAPDQRAGETPRNARFATLVPGANYAERMVALYDEEMAHVRRNYELVGGLDPSLLREFDVSPKRVLECLKARLSGMKVTYWGELFNNMQQITDRLISSHRRRMLTTLQRNCHVDFTLSNIHAIVLWVLKNANVSLDDQLVETFERMVEKANVRNYKSNTRPFVYDCWRYSEEKPTHVALEYRIVLDRIGGLTGHGFGYRVTGLSDSAGAFIGDLLTVANNLGFLCKTDDVRLAHSGRAGWSSDKQVFTAKVGGKEICLLEVRAFFNGNLHIRMHQKFALALNVEYGRLKGWLKSGPEASEELGDEAAAEHFGTNLALGHGALPMLCAPAEMSACA